MKINFDQTIFNLVADKPWFQERDGKREDLTLRNAALEALSMSMPEATLLELAERFDLLKKVKGADLETDFTVEQVSTVKSVLAKCYQAPHLVGAAFELLEGGV